MPVEPFCSTTLTERLAGVAAEEALAEASIGTKGDFPGPLFLAVAPVEMEWSHRETICAEIGTDSDVSYDDLLRATGSRRFAAIHERCLFGSVADHLGDRFGTKGSPISLTTACASGASAIQLGVEAIRRGETDVALCIGADGSVNPESLIRLASLCLVDGERSAGDGSETVLEEPRRLRHGRRRGRPSPRKPGPCQGARRKNPRRDRRLRRDGGLVPPDPLSPDGQPIIGCIRNAIADAGLTPEDIDYINPHGTGTPENDKMECLGVSAVFAERAKNIPISSNKSMIGHTLSAAGAVEAVFTLLTIEHQRLPPTINYQVPDPAIRLNVVPNAARDAKVRHALSNSFGFGGQNVALVMGREPV